MTTPSRPVALITGGASVLGIAWALRWASPGGGVVHPHGDAYHPCGALAALGADRARGVSCDVTDAASVDAAVASVRATEARLDSVINSAGIARPEPSERITDAAFSALLDIHVTGTMRVCRAAYPALRETRGSIVTVASVAAFAGMPGRAAYTAAKAAVTGLTRTLAVEWAASGVRVNAIAPGYVRTALTDRLIARGELDPSTILARTPQGRFAEPAEIAAAVQFLAGPDASFVTGHTLLADGGLTVGGDWY